MNAVVPRETVASCLGNDDAAKTSENARCLSHRHSSLVSRLQFFALTGNEPPLLRELVVARFRIGIGQAPRHQLAMLCALYELPRNHLPAGLEAERRAVSKTRVASRSISKR
jgi:hypothetical protein